MGADIPFIPNKREGGIVLGGKIAPIFFNTMEDAEPYQLSAMVKDANGDVITILRTKAGLPMKMVKLSPSLSCPPLFC